MKRILSVLLCVVLCVGTLSVSAPALAQKAAASEKTMLIVELEGENALDAVSEGLTLQKALRPIDAGRKNAVQEIRSVSEGANVAYTYTHVLNAVAIETAKGDAARIEQLDGVRAVYDVGGVKVQAETVPSDSLISSGSMIGVDKLHEMGIDGTGTAIAVIDGGLQWDHEAMTLSDPSSAKITKADVAAVIRANTMNCSASTDDLYKNAKIPFAYDYCDNDTQVEDYNNAEPDHGTHVSGIAAGNSDKLVGVAPEAQVLMFKIDVYDDQTFFANLLAAIDDAAKFEIASMNMSVGIEFESRTDPAYALLVKAIETARNNGISVCTAAGNSGVMSDSVTDPDNGTNGLPNSVADATSVASVDNVNLSRPISYSIEAMQYDGGKRIEVTGYSSMAFPAEGEFVPIGKSGPSASDAGKVYLFNDVNVNIKPYLEHTDAAALIVSESVLDTYIEYFFSMDYSIEFLLVSAVDAYRLAHSKDRSFSLIYEQYYAEPADILRSSSFTSYGVSEDLELTVDIAAPGGIIYSSVTGGQYDIYNGTSMASPHIAGSAALLEQHIQKAYPDVQGREKADLKENLMCSTADPILSDGVPVSPRAVGAGLVNLGEAVTANAVLTDSNGRAALNLGDGIEDTIDLTFTVRNVSSKDVRYDTLKFDVITDDYVTEKQFDNSTGTYSSRSRITGQSVPLRYTIVKSDMPRSISLQSGESAAIHCTLQMDAQQLIENAEVFTNGFYVEGYVYLTDSMTGQTPLNIPFMGFRGDWTAVPAVSYGEILMDYWGMIYNMGEGFKVSRNLKSISFVLLDADGNECAAHTEEYVRKGQSFNKEEIANLLKEKTVPDGTYSLLVKALPEAPGAREQIIESGETILIDHSDPTILDAKMVRTADGIDMIVTCVSGDLDYIELFGANLFERKFYDLYPVDGFDSIDENGNYVYIVHEDRSLLRRPVVTVTEKSGNTDTFGRYSLILQLVFALDNALSDVLMWFVDRLSSYLYD